MHHLRECAIGVFNLALLHRGGSSSKAFGWVQLMYTHSIRAFSRPFAQCRAQLSQPLQLLHAQHDSNPQPCWGGRV